MPSPRSPNDGRAYLSAVMGGQNRFALGRVYTGPSGVDEVLRARRPLYAIVGLLVLASLLLRQPLIFIAGLLLAALTALPEVWYRFGLRDLVIRHSVSQTRAALGDAVEVAVVMENRKALPLPSLEIADEFPDALPVIGVRLDPSPQPGRAVLRSAPSLWAYQRVTRRYQVRAVSRGVHIFGPMKLRLGDPFDFLIREHAHEATATLLVHPLVARIEQFGLSARAPFGERATPQRLLEDPLRVAGTRAYAPGDDPRRIHWKATARTGILQSKVLEPSARHTILLCLDIRTLAKGAIGFSPEMVELAICAAASVAQWGLEQGYAVGIIANGTLATPDMDAQTHLDTPVSSTAEDAQERIARALAKAAVAFRLRVAPSARAEQLPHLLDGLARLWPYYGAPIHILLAAETRKLPPGATVVFIGAEPVIDVPTLVTLRQLRSHGHAVSMLLTTQDRLDDLPTEPILHLADIPVHRLGGKRAWEALVAETLGPGPLRRASSALNSLHTDAERRAFLASIHQTTTPRQEPPAAPERNHDGDTSYPAPGRPRTLLFD